MVEKNYKNVQEELDDKRKMIKKLRIKFKNAKDEINDLSSEHQQ
jgi:cell division protein FtsL